MNCWFVPSAIDALAGETEIETSTGAVTVNVADATIVPELALMFAIPWVRPVASPALFTVAIAGADDVQFTVLVRFCVLPSLYDPVAVNC